MGPICGKTYTAPQNRNNRGRYLSAASCLFLHGESVGHFHQYAVERVAGLLEVLPWLTSEWEQRIQLFALTTPLIWLQQPTANSKRLSYPSPVISLH